MDKTSMSQQKLYPESISYLTIKEADDNNFHQRIGIFFDNASYSNFKIFIHENYDLDFLRL